MRIGYIGLSVLLLTAAGSVSAQDHTIVDVSGGMGVSYVKTGDMNVKYGSMNLPHASICAVIPVQGWFFLRTGLSYKQKGFVRHINAMDSASVFSDITNKQKLHYVSAPLQLCYRAPITSRSEYFISAGMDYGFLVRADSRMETNTYENGSLVHNSVVTSHPRVGFLAESTPFQSKDGVQYLLFSPSVRVDASFFWEKQYSLSAFWEYDLTDVSANSRTYTSRIICFGFSVGVLLQ
jgi:hypothetical protein